MSENKPDLTWETIATSRLAPALAGVCVERFCSNDFVSDISTALGLTIQDIRSAILFAAIILLTNPMIYVRGLKTLILAVRIFWGSAKNEIEEAMTKPIETESTKGNEK